MNDQNDFQILEDYCKQDGRRLRGEVDAILSRFGGIVQADRDDFYSLANETLARAWQGYDGTKDFHGFFHTCLENRIKSEITRRNRQKRRADREALSIDAPAGEDGSCLKDMLPSDFDIEKETGLFEGGGCSTDFSGTRASRFLDQLSAFQRRIVEMRLKGMSKKEIVRALGIRERAYEEQLSAIRSYDNVSILLEKEAPEKRREDMGGGDVYGSTDSGKEQGDEIFRAFLLKEIGGFYDPKGSSASEKGQPVDEAAEGQPDHVRAE